MYFHGLRASCLLVRQRHLRDVFLRCQKSQVFADIRVRFGRLLLVFFRFLAYAADSIPQDEITPRLSPRKPLSPVSAFHPIKERRSMSLVECVTKLNSLKRGTVSQDFLNSVVKFYSLLPAFPLIRLPRLRTHQL